MTERVDAIALLREKLLGHPELTFVERAELGESWLRIKAAAPDGFDVSLHDNLDEWTVHYGLAHDHFVDGIEALDRVALLLSNEGRLVETWRGSFLQSTKTQRLAGGEWRTIMINGALFWPFWRRKTRVVRRNQLGLKGSAPVG